MMITFLIGRDFRDFSFFTLNANCYTVDPEYTDVCKAVTQEILNNFDNQTISFYNV